MVLGLAPIVYAKNTSGAKPIKKTPYEVVFGQKLRSDFEMWKLLSESGIEDEEKLPQEFIDTLNEGRAGPNQSILGGCTEIFGRLLLIL